jgi:hypothetical protein
MKTLDILSLVLVGAFWGCTNPWLRRGSSQLSSASNEKDESNLGLSNLADSVKKIKNVRVWLPFVLNQFGSVVFYVLLAKSNLTLAVPICNGLALVFSSLTSYSLGEKVDKPLLAILGAALVTVGVALCMHSQQIGEKGFG